MPFLPPNQQRQSTEGKLTNGTRLYTCASSQLRQTFRKTIYDHNTKYTKTDTEVMSLQNKIGNGF